jgi:hypothetical protein
VANVKKTGIRAIRKGAHITHRAFVKGAHFTSKVEDKTTRIITGKDFSVKVDSSIPIEKAVFNGVKYNISPLNPALPAVGRPGKVTILIPSLNKQSFFGGTATVLIVAAKISQKLRQPLRIVETLEPGGKEGLGDFLEKNNIHLPDGVELIDVSARTYDRYGYIDLHPDDVFVTSAWWDAKLVSQLPLNRKFIYLIQDYEPIFYANSDEYILAEATYKSNNFIPLCNTQLMYDFMSQRGYKYIQDQGIWFEPAVSRKSFGTSLKNEGKRRIFLYGRPSVARNLFYSALMALNQVFDTGALQTGEWEIFMAGQDKIPNIALSTGITIKNLGKLSMEDYSDFIKTVDIALSPMMAPHPNYPTLEFASVGAAVVTTKYATKQSLDKYSKNILLAEPDINDLAKKIAEASQMSHEQRINNLQTTAILDNWDESLKASIDTIAKQLFDH